MLFPKDTPRTKSLGEEFLTVGVSKRVDVELKKRWFKQKAGDFMATRKRSATKTRKMILTGVIGSLAALGIGGAGYLTWSAISGSDSGRRVESVYHAQKTNTYSNLANSAPAVSRSKIARHVRVKSGASCKITKSKKHKLSKHKASKHKRKKLHHAH